MLSKSAEIFAGFSFSAKTVCDMFYLFVVCPDSNSLCSMKKLNLMFILFLSVLSNGKGKRAFRADKVLSQKLRLSQGKQIVWMEGRK